MVRVHLRTEAGRPTFTLPLILCAEVLTRFIRREQVSCRLTGLPIGGEQGHLSHMLYTYDNLLVAKASFEEADVIKRVLDEYCSMSGQKVNMTKSHVIFGSDVQVRQHRRLKGHWI